MIDNYLSRNVLLFSYYYHIDQLIEQLAEDN